MKTFHQHTTKDLFLDDLKAREESWLRHQREWKERSHHKRVPRKKGVHTNTHRPSILITDGDRHLFELLLVQKVASMDHLSRYLYKKSLPVVSLKEHSLSLKNRVRELVAGGYLRTTSVEGKQVVTLGAPALAELENTRGLAPVSVFSLKNIEHDLAVTAMRLYLEAAGGAEWLSDREIMSSWVKPERIPNGIIRFGRLKVFVEVVTYAHPTASLVEKIIQIYDVMPDADRVLFVACNARCHQLVPSQLSKRFGIFELKDHPSIPKEYCGYQGGEKTIITLSRFLEIA